MQTSMWKEIQDQPDVVEKLLEVYLPKAEYYRELLKRKKQLVLTGIGASLNACHMARYAFFKYCNLKPQIVQSDELCYLLPSIDKETLVIFVSQSGESYETKIVGQQLKENGIEFWGITNDENSSLAKNATEVFLLYSGREISSATKTNLASFILLAIIAAGYDEKVKKVLCALSQKLKATLDNCLIPLETLADYLLPHSQFYILGMGANAGTAIEGALMMQEKTFIHTTGSSISDFRHGTVEVIEKELPILLLASGKINTEIALQHAGYLKDTGAEVYLCTDIRDSIAMDICPVIPVEEVGEEIISLAALLMPLQLLAERVAVKKGLNVDGFRYLSKIVGDYKKNV